MLDITSDDDMNDGVHWMPEELQGNPADGPADGRERGRADQCRNEIPAAMWVDYLEE